MQDAPFFENNKWVLRLVWGTHLYFYLDGPLDGIDDGSANDILSWQDYAIEPIYQFGDYPETLDAFKGKKVFKQSVRKSDTSHAYFYHVDSLEPSKSITDCKYRASFQGSLLTWKHRPKIADAVKRFDSYAFRPLNTFWWAVDEKDRKKLYQSYCELLDDTQFVFCPKGRGLNSVRFFETLRMGRIPIFISDQAKLPLEWMIDYSRCVVRVPEVELLRTKDYVDDFLKVNDIVESSEMARRISTMYFQNSKKFEELHATPT